MTDRQRQPVAPGRRLVALGVVLDGSAAPVGGGLEAVATAWRAAVAAHARTATPLTVHLTGALAAALAWDAPDVLASLRSLDEQGLLGVLGTTSTEAALPDAPPEVARLQVTEGLRALEHHLGIDASTLTTAWVPHRQWSTDTVAPVLSDPMLPNGGFDWVLLDDRALLASTARQGRSPRARFDALLERVGDQAPSADAAAELAEHLVLRHIEGTPLSAAPISTAVERWFPLRDPDDLRWWREVAFAACRTAADRSVLVWVGDPATAVADDEAAAAYERSLVRLRREAPVTVVVLPRWLARHEAAEDTAVEPTFDLAPSAPRPTPLVVATGRTLDLVDRTDGTLAQLARRHVLTGWQQSPESGGAAAAVALAREARAAPILAAAARWLAVHHDMAWADVHDIDEDGEDEVVLGGDRLHVVVAPSRGARISSLAVATAGGGALAVGNPGDGEAGDHPALDHAGALLLVDGERDRWAVRSTSEPGRDVTVVLEDVEAGSRHLGTELTLQLAVSSGTVVARYSKLADDAVLLCNLSPDYAHLVDAGAGALHVDVDDGGCLATAGRVRLRVGAPPDHQDDIAVWSDHPYPAPAHAHLAVLRARSGEVTVHLSATEVATALGDPP